ncbi:MAG: NAD(P)-binding domain-containing protein [Pseudomonadota bacterium]
MSILDQPTDTVAIIGGGPAGLATARALKTVGLPFVLFEKHRDVGGIWDRENAGSPMYRSAHFISSRTMSGHEGYPMPDSFPDYPSNGQILSYIQDFAADFGLYDHIRLNTPVDRVTKDGDGWVVQSSAEGQPRSERFRWLVCASGTNWHPNRPAIKGEETFTGEIVHSVAYDGSDSLKGQRVLVVGAGNSGVDIACDAAFAADEAYTSMRRGYHFVPKHIFGQPADVFGSKSSWMPMWLTQLVFGGLLRQLNGDLTRLGLQKPDHKIFESHPIMNTQVLHYLQHGDLIAKPDLDRLEGEDAVFSDGSRAAIDLVILATGYNWTLPYLDDGLFEWKNNRPQTFLKIFNPDQPSLFVNGYIETNSGAYKLFDEMGLLIAQTIAAQARDPAKARQIQATIEGPEPNLGGKVAYVESARHTGYTNVTAYTKAMKAMRDQLGWPDPSAFYEAAPKAAPSPAQGIASEAA